MFVFPEHQQQLLVVQRSGCKCIAYVCIYMHSSVCHQAAKQFIAFDRTVQPVLHFLFSHLISHMINSASCQPRSFGCTVLGSPYLALFMNPFDDNGPAYCHETYTCLGF